MDTIKLSSVFAVLVLCTSVSHAEIFKWTDESGLTHFTDQYHKVPPRYRDKGQEGDTVDTDAPPARESAPDTGSEGARLYRERCAGCHPLPQPERFMKDDWDKLMDDMEKEMEKKDMTPLTPYERSTILDFLRRRSR